MSVSKNIFALDTTLTGFLYVIKFVSDLLQVVASPRYNIM